MNTKVVTYGKEGAKRCKKNYDVIYGRYLCRYWGTGSSTGKDELPCQLSNEGSRRCQLLDAKSDPHETSEIGLQSNIFIKTNQNRVLLRYVGAGMLLLLLKMPQRCSIHEPITKSTFSHQIAKALTQPHLVRIRLDYYIIISGASIAS